MGLSLVPYRPPQQLIFTELPQVLPLGPLIAPHGHIVPAPGSLPCSTASVLCFVSIPFKGILYIDCVMG